MPPLPKPTASTVKAIYAALESEAREQYDQWGINVGDADHECSRAIWYSLRWVTEKEKHDGRTLSIFETGNIWEARIVADLERAGIEVTGQQDKIRLLSGHIRGKRDGAAMNVLEAPKTEHLLEIKSSKQEDYRQLVKHGVRKAKPLHFAQCQLGMHAFGLTRCLYVVVNKNTDERHAERIEYGAEYCIRLLARLQSVIDASQPPPRIGNGADDFRCLPCRHKATCWGDVWPRANCRTCLHSSPEHGGDAHWSCSRWGKPLGIEEQKSGCPAHLFVPGLINGEQIDVDEESETVRYRLADGTEWVDGAHE